MSFSLYLLCQSDVPITRAEVASFIEDGSYFDAPPVFEPDISGELGELTIQLANERLVKLKKLDGEEAEGAVAECLESLDSAPISNEQRERLRTIIRRTRNVIEVQVDRETTDKDTWAMLDALEAHILRTRQGLLYVYDEGVYGADLKLWSVGSK